VGLDWNPIGKPRPGHEDEFARLFKQLGDLSVNVGWVERLRRRLVGIDRAALHRRWNEIQVTPYETVGAPRVGESAEADAWALSEYANREDQRLSQNEFMRQLAGYYVLALVPECDGLPYYSNSPIGYVERFSFRAQCLRDCEDVIGTSTLEKCYVSCLAPGLEALGNELRAWATSFAKWNSLQHMEFIREAQFEEKSAESKAHILFSAARWCEFWSSRGHGLEAYW